MRIESIAPTRADLAGGTLDIWPLYLFHRGALTVNVAITRYARCVLEPAAGSRRIRLVSRDTGRAQTYASLDALLAAKKHRLPLLAHLVRIFCETRRPDSGFTLATDSEAPAGAGIGGSSALAVALCAALDRFTGAGLSPVDWIHLSRDAEAMVIGVPTGTQDHYPAVFGGASSILLLPGTERREAVEVDLDALEQRLLVCYTGKPRQSGINNWEVFKAHLDGQRRIRRNFDYIAGVARALRRALERADWTAAGRLMREEWNFRRKNLPTISTPKIDRILAAAQRAGALGGKVCGAGGGGCVTLLVPPENRERVAGVVTAAGGELLAARVDRSGVRVQLAPESA